MEIAFNLLHMLLASTTIAALETRFFAVTPLNGSQQYYVNMKRFGRSVKKSTVETDEEKADVCAAIVQSPFFYMHHIDPAVHDDHHNSNYSSTSRNIDIGPHVFRENVFSCFAKNRTSGNIVQFFISSTEYDVNESTNKNAEQIMGRFVFANDKNDELSVLALAEPPAEIDYNIHLCEYELTTTNMGTEPVEYYSWKNDEDKQPIICSLSTLQKLRICSTILSEENYIGKVIFLPHERNIDPKCESRLIQFTEKFGPYESQEEIPSSISEWMMGCKTTKVATNDPATLYVSRGYEANMFFIYTGFNEVTSSVQGKCSKISVVPAQHL